MAVTSILKGLILVSYREKGNDIILCCVVFICEVARTNTTIFFSLLSTKTLLETQDSIKQHVAGRQIRVS
jgi:uncharacterized membrane protein